jgi:23S rRNA (guanosine2251-2'-O)-methyltransferase
MTVYGAHAVFEALRAGRVTRLLLVGRPGGAPAPNRRTSDLVAEAQRAGVRVETIAEDDAARLAGGRAHQGVLAEVTVPRDWTPADLVAAARTPGLFVVLDGVEDPHNLGAILRTADAAGVDGVVRQARRAAPLEGAVAKTSAGAVAHLRIATVVNISRAIEELKEAGVWTVGLAADGGDAYDAIDLTVPTAIVVGAEGAGLRRLVRESCDRVAAIPMAGHVSSLNVSVATAIVLFEAARQRRKTQDPGVHATRRTPGS